MIPGKKIYNFILSPISCAASWTAATSQCAPRWRQRWTPSSPRSAASATTRGPRSCWRTSTSSRSWMELLLQEAPPLVGNSVQDGGRKHGHRLPENARSFYSRRASWIKKIRKNFRRGQLEMFCLDLDTNDIPDCFWKTMWKHLGSTRPGLKFTRFLWTGNVCLAIFLI